MSALPAPLKPWAAQLSLLQRDLALALAPWIQRLSASIGPLSDAQVRPTGAPDGYDGVARKGSYERLLTSEWLYADEVPDEFLRRAAQGEHLFSKLAVREPHQARRCLVLFDSGPSQLGAPRIAHLAAFIAFASRCEAAHAQLSWGVLQQARHRRDGFDKAEAEALLKSRTTREATDADLSAWLETMGAADDVWVVGSGLASSKVQQVVVSECMEPGVRRLEVTVRRGGRARQSVHLELPPATVCTSLLRAPFAIEKPKPTPRASRPTQGLVFGASGNRLFTLGGTGELISVVLPHGTGASVKQVAFQPPALERVVAGGWHKGLICITARHDTSGRIIRFVLHSLTKRGDKRVDPLTFEVDDPATVLPPEPSLTDITVFSFNGKKRFLFVMSGRLFSLEDGRATVSPERIVAHTQRSERLLLFIVDEQGRRTVRTLFSNTTQTATHLEGLGTARVHFAGGMRYPLPMMGLGALSTSPTWTMVDHSRLSFGLEVPEGGTVMGVTTPSTWVAGLLVRTENKKRLLHVSAQGTQTIVETESPIIEVATDFEFPRAAWLDAGGGLGLFDASNPQRLIIGLPDGNGRRMVHFTEYRR